MNVCLASSSIVIDLLAFILVMTTWIYLKEGLQTVMTLGVIQKKAKHHVKWVDSAALTRLEKYSPNLTLKKSQTSFFNSTLIIVFGKRDFNLLTDKLVSCFDIFLFN